MQGCSMPQEGWMPTWLSDRSHDMGPPDERVRAGVWLFSTEVPRPLGKDYMTTA